MVSLFLIGLEQVLAQLERQLAQGYGRDSVGRGSRRVTFIQSTGLQDNSVSYVFHLLIPAMVGSEPPSGWVRRSGWLQSHSGNFEQVDLKLEGGASWDDIPDALGPVGQGWWDGQLPGLPDAHSDDAVVPALGKKYSRFVTGSQGLGYLMSQNKRIQFTLIK